MAQKHKQELQNDRDYRIIARDSLIEDTRDLLYYLETIHPDPYLYSGGKVQFHRRFQNVLQAIPENGLTTDEYIEIIKPFIASISDAHTRIARSYEYDRENPGGLPLSFASVEKSIYVNGVYNNNFQAV